MPHIQSTAPSPRRKSVRQGVLEPKSQTLEHGVLTLFPFASENRLRPWSESLERESGLEAEPLLFLAAVCGARFQLVRLDPGEICDELAGWLRSHPRRMRRELVAVLIEALRPAVERVADQQGWRRGLDWKSVEVHGRPDETRGAWAAAVLADAHLARSGCDAPRAAELARSLASALLARDTRLNEFYAHRAALSGRDTGALLSELLEAYEQLLDTHAVRQRDPNPGPGSSEYPAWRARHRALPYLLARDGCEETARQVAKGIREPLWAAMEATPTSSRVGADDSLSSLEAEAN